MYDISKLYEPRSIPEAVDLLQKHPEARILAGGSDLLLKIRESKLAGIECVSIYKLDVLRGIFMEEDGSIVILPLTSFSHVAQNELVLKHIPVLAEAVETIGGPQIRNIGTIGGNVCNGVTSADSASTLFSLDAQLELTGSGGVRALPIHDFYIGPGKVDLRPTEILTAIRIPKKSYEGYHGKFIKYAMRKAMDISTLNCSVNVRLSGDKKLIEDVRIAFGVAAPTPMRCAAAENCTCGRPVSEEALRSLVDTALSEITPRTSWRASRELRMQLAAEVAMRALKEAIQRAGGVLG